MIENLNEYYFIYPAVESFDLLLYLMVSGCTVYAFRLRNPSLS